MALREVSNLSKDFGGLRAVSDLSFVLNQGEILGLIGPNGAGKTTAFNLMSGFLAPATGTVRLDGHELIGLRRMPSSNAEWRARSRSSSRSAS